jgi:GT2 family glycosyltransferase
MTLSVAVVIPNWNGERWLPDCLDSVAAQTLPPSRTIVVDNGSTDGSPSLLAARPDVETVALGRNTGFAFAANRGVEVAETELVALVNTDVILDPDWLDRMVAALESDPRAASAACKMVDLAEPTVLYDAGDVLRRDGACEQRGRFELDDGRFDRREEVFGACAGAALYRRSTFLDAGGLDERYVIYLEDVDLALRLRLAGWRCVYEPARAKHAGEGSSRRLPDGHHFWVARNTILLVAKAFPVRWLPQVAYRQLAWAWHALKGRHLTAHVRGLAAVLPLLPSLLRERRQLRHSSHVSLESVVQSRPIRGPRAGGHPSRHATAR